MSIQIKYTKANFSDGMNNLIWRIECPQCNEFCLVDPGYEAEVRDLLATSNYRLTSVLITHHHWDHTDAVEYLLQCYPDLPIYGSYQSPFALINRPLRQGQQLSILAANMSLKVLETPGHTLDHVCYYDAKHGFCFVGDTLFAGGVGKMFEGTADQFYQSVTKIQALAEHTRLFVGHDYFFANMAFALKVEPSNAAIKERLESVKNKQHSSVETTLGLEKLTNPFLRTNRTEIQKACQQLEHIRVDNPIDTFASLRRLR